MLILSSSLFCNEFKVYNYPVACLNELCVSRSTIGYRRVLPVKYKGVGVAGIVDLRLRARSYSFMRFSSSVKSWVKLRPSCYLRRWYSSRASLISAILWSSISKLISPVLSSSSWGKEILTFSCSPSSDSLLLTISYARVYHSWDSCCSRSSYEFVRFLRYRGSSNVTILSWLARLCLIVLSKTSSSSAYFNICLS